MPPEDQLFGADRAVLYLEVATKVLCELDGSKENAIRGAIEQFKKSPKGAFNKHPAEFVGQIRHLDTNTRAFATWCQNEVCSAELCVVQTIYRKSNEDKFFARLQNYNSEGQQYADGIAQLDQDEYDAYLGEHRQKTGVRLVE